MIRTNAILGCLLVLGGVFASVNAPAASRSIQAASGHVWNGFLGSAALHTNDGNVYAVPNTSGVWVVPIALSVTGINYDGFQDAVAGSGGGIWGAPPFTRLVSFSPDGNVFQAGA